MFEWWKDRAVGPVGNNGDVVKEGQGCHARAGAESALGGTDFEESNTSAVCPGGVGNSGTACQANPPDRAGGGVKEPRDSAELRAGPGENIAWSRVDEVENVGDPRGNEVGSDDAPLPPLTSDDGGEAEDGETDARADEFPPPLSPRRLMGWGGRGRKLTKKPEPHKVFSGPAKLTILDTWKRSGLPAGDFASLVGISKHTLYAWRKLFEEYGPAGLAPRPKGGPRGSRTDDLTKRAILMMKESHPEWGCQRISDMLVRDPALSASPSTVAKILHEAGYELEETPTRPHPPTVHRFERAKPNQLWQTDLFTFMLKRQNRRVYLVVFMDDYSRFIVGYGLHATQSAALVIEVFLAGVTSYGPPEEVLTDNGAQYITWRGKGAFTKELEKRGVRQIVAKPRRPQTLGKVERFWGSLWREFLEAAIFVDLADAQKRIGLFIDHYNFRRPHQGIDGLVPADRFFEASKEVANTLKAQVSANALELARHGVPKQPFYLTGKVGGNAISLHAEGEKMILVGPLGRQEVDLTAPSGATAVTLPATVCPHGAPTNYALDEEVCTLPEPGTSPLDPALSKLAAAGGTSNSRKENS